jgi:AraC family transcriptional regulator
MLGYTYTMNEATTKAYQKRMNKVFDYIKEHLDEELSVDGLSEVVHFSKYHFHRQFSEYTGISVGKFIQLIRLKRASYRLAFRKHNRIIDIAMNAGFESPEAFSRAFKKAFGQTPTQFREIPAWEPWREKYQFFNKGVERHMNTGKHNMQVKLVDFKATKVAVLEHRGAPERIYESIRTFIAWRKENKLSPDVSETYNILYGDPATSEPDQYRLDICASIQSNVKDNPYGVITKMIPNGRCAVLRHTGPDDNIGDSFHYLYANWLPQSGEELRDFPCFLHRVTLFPDIPEHKMITDIYLPLR